MKALAKKISLVMAEASYVQKKGFNSHQKYNYATEADILETLRESFVKHGVVVFPSVTSCTRDGDLTTLVLTYTFIDSDSGEVFAVQAVGTGKDNADKGAYKAYTGASKYVLMKTFLLATGDDPEDDGVPAPEPTPAKKPAVKSMKQALEEDDI